MEQPAATMPERVGRYLIEGKLGVVGHQGGLYYSAFTPDGKELATAGVEDWTIRLWDLPPACHVRRR